MIGLEIRAYPQPANSTLMVEGVGSFEIVSLLGAMMYSSKNTGIQKQEIETSDWSPGIYVLTDNTSIRRKIIIQ